MKLAHVIHAFPPASHAGSEIYAETLAREQLRRGHEVVVFHRVAEPERPEYEVSEAQLGELPVVRINRTFADLRAFEDTYRSASVAAAFGAFLDRARPDLVHFHHTTCLSTTCIHEAFQRGIPSVYTLHDFWLICPRGQRLRRDLALCRSHDAADCVRCMAYQLRIRGGHARVHALGRRAASLARLRLPAALYRKIASRPFAREADATGQIRERSAHVRDACGRVGRFVAPSRFLRDRYVEFGLPPERIEVSDYGFDPGPWRRARPDAAPGPLRVAYLGTWIPSKGVHVLVEAFRGLDPAEAVLDVHGYAVPYDGFEDYEGHLRRLATGAPHVRFRGAYRPDETPGLLARADVLVAPSIWWENSPLTIHEAFLAGVPVVVSDHGGMRELVRPEVDGLGFRPGDADDLRQVLGRLARDRALLERLRRGVPRVKPIARNADELDAIYGDAARWTADARTATAPADRVPPGAAP